jgi:hypothetical protein
MKVSYTGGAEDVNIGDRFKFSAGDSWEIVRPAGSMYSPSSIGPCPNFACKSLDERIPEWLRKYVEVDGTVVFCGDSIASALSGKYGGGRLTSPPLAGHQEETGL